jgi:hypothetical protein
VGPGSVCTIWKSENSWPYRDSNSDLFIVQPVGSRYSNCATVALIRTKTKANSENMRTLQTAEMRFLGSVKGYSELDEGMNEGIRKELSVTQ